MQERRNNTHCKYCNSQVVIAEQRDGGLFIMCLACKGEFPALRVDDSKIMTFKELANEYNG